MEKPERETEAMQAYRRTLGEVAENRVVAAAEDVLTDTWIEELEHFRSIVLGMVGSVCRAERIARDEVRAAQMRSSADEIARAHRHLEAVSVDGNLDLHEVRRLLDALDGELELACQVGMARARRTREDYARLRAAWHGAYGRGGG